MVTEEKFLSFLEIFEIGELKVLNSEFINQKFRTLAKKYHPDACGGDSEKFTLLNEAKSFFLENLDLIKQIIESQNSPGLQTIMTMVNFLTVLRDDYVLKGDYRSIISVLEQSMEYLRLNLSVKFYFFASLVLSKLNKKQIDFDSAIHIICQKAIDFLNELDYSKLDFPNLIKNIELFKENGRVFSDEERLFYSIYHFYDLFMNINFEDREDLKIKSKILFKEYLRDLEGFKCYCELMPSEHKIMYYTRKFWENNHGI